MCWAVSHQLHFPLCERAVVKFTHPPKALWATGVKIDLRAALRSLLWVWESRQGAQPSTPSLQWRWDNVSSMGYCCSQGLFTGLARLPGGKLKRVKWTSGFLQNLSLLWSLHVLILVSFPLLCAMWGEGLWDMGGEGEAWKVGHLQDNGVESQEGCQEIYSASGFIWYEQENSLSCLSLTKEAHF